VVVFVVVSAGLLRAIAITPTMHKAATDPSARTPSELESLMTDTCDLPTVGLGSTLATAAENTR
jgi:hypothetical protein